MGTLNANIVRWGLSMPSIPLSERISYTLPDAAEVSGISVRSLWRLIKSGELKIAHVGKRVIVPRESLASLISAHLVGAKEASA